MFVIHPRRHDEDVALLPVEALAVDDRMALSLGALIDEAAGLAVRLCALAGAQQLHRRADGRHDGSPGGTVHIIHDDAFIWPTVRCLRLPDARFIVWSPPIFEDRRIGLFSCPAPRRQSGAQT